MRAIAVSSWGSTPTFTDSASAPSKSSNTATQIEVLAAAMPQLVRSQASGTHYSTQGAPLPYIPGVDGVGYTSNDNKFVYFQTFTNNPPGGAFAETVVAPNTAVTPIELPESSLQSLTTQRNQAIKVASLFNPFMSSWLALKSRAYIDELRSSNEKFNILILGVTSTSGRLATLAARHLGASQIIGVARDATALSTLQKSGRIDHAITLDTTDPTQTDYSLLNEVRVHIVLDYIYGSHALALLAALPKSPSKADDLEVRYVHVGTLGKEADIALPGMLLRSKNVVISGSGPGSWSTAALTRETPSIVKGIIELVDGEGWREEYGVVERKPEDVEEAWNDTKSRSVFIMCACVDEEGFVASHTYTSNLGRFHG